MVIELELVITEFYTISLMMYYWLLLSEWGIVKTFTATNETISLK